MFPLGMKVSHVPHLVILGSPIGDYLLCASYIASKHTEAMKLLSWLVEVACLDPQVTLILLRMCRGYCKLVHLARATPRSLASDPLQLFDAEVRECFTLCTAVPASNLTWQQAQLSLSHGGLGLRSVSHHSSVAYIASLCSSGFANRDHKHVVDCYCFPVQDGYCGIHIGFTHASESTILEDRGSSILSTL